MADYLIGNLLPFLQTQGYVIIFILMFIEGPIVTFVSAFAASLGVFNPFLILLLSIAGNFLPDLMYYSIGKLLKHKVLFKVFKRFDVKKKKIYAIEKALKNHAGKMMVLVKVVPPIPPLGLTIAGMVLPFKRFFYLSVIISAIYSLSFFALGYFAGNAYNLFVKYFHAGEILIAIIIALFIIGWILIKHVFNKQIKSAV